MVHLIKAYIIVIPKDRHDILREITHVLCNHKGHVPKLIFIVEYCTLIQLVVGPLNV
jgi:hypothetical protein